MKDWYFFRYFLLFIFSSRTRQKLLFLAILGLMLSSFSLIVVQGVMGGLQKGLIDRSKIVNGHGHLIINPPGRIPKGLKTDLEKMGTSFALEYELEVILKNHDHLQGAIIRATDKERLPAFLANKDLGGLVLGGQLSLSMQAYHLDDIQVVSPLHTDAVLGDLPRSATSYVSGFYNSQLPEVDGVYLWTRLSFIQNLLRSHGINRIRFYGPVGHKQMRELATKYALRYQSWDETHKNLVWALRLETTVMVFLFICMSFLVSLAITSGFMIFFDKVKNDLLSFWALGMDKVRVIKLALRFSHFLGMLFSLLGVSLGLLVLLFLKSNPISFMPDLFVEQKIPVSIEWQSAIIAFAVPYLITVIFSRQGGRSFIKENSNFLEIIRQVGR